VTDDEARLWDLLWGAGRGALVTIKRDGRAQVSTIDYTADPSTRTLRVSTTAGRAKVANLRRDPRASFYVTAGNGSAYAVGEGEALGGPTARTVDDAAVEEVIEVYRRISGERPDWADYRPGDGRGPASGPEYHLQPGLRLGRTGGSSEHAGVAARTRRASLGTAGLKFAR
jgi:PPOX class probable F420-dependent enzyme